MAARHWFRPPRQMLAVFLGVALVSAGALGWLGWLLLKQDAALESQRRRDMLEQAADRASATMQLAVVELQAALNSPASGNKKLAPGVSRVSIGPDAVTIRPDGSLPYYPDARGARPEPLQTFAEGEQAEFARNDPTGAARAYARLATTANPDVRAGALARLARVHRKQRDIDAALRAYEQLAAIEQADVDGMPAALVARAGRASVFEESGRQPDLRQEAAALQRDLQQGRWRLVKSQYEFYAGQASAWLGAPSAEDRDALTRAEATEWLWQNRASLSATVRRAIALPSGPALMVGQSSSTGLDAMVAGPTFVAALCSQAVAADLRCGLSDPEGRALAGDRPQGRDTAVRAASASGLPWTLHVSARAEAAAVPSPRRRLLVLAFAVVALVLAAGWYFILRAMSRELRVSRLQAEFVAAVSHEFRSPLTSLSHIAELLATDRLASDDLRRKSYDVLVRDTDRLQRLVEGLLDFGRFDAGAAALRLEDVDVSTLVRTTVADFRDRVAADGYAVELSGADAQVLARIDREAISRALWNLLDNAVKYSPECRTVWVALERQDERVSIVVRDQGLGIPINEQREIFDRFVRGAESTARRIRGTGIGLAMVRQIVRAHGGDVSVASEPGKGSTFTLALRVHA
ncbi:MAG: HAMP domain-containing histidine kinase [Acidobacteria bacterium]|nr:HAMP domain-containing histidine kinase [Acidobacteriota bacterium]